MKMKLLSVAVAGVLGGAGTVMAAPTAAPSGIGDALVVPYFSVQDGNATLINIINTDDGTTNDGKVVKIRYRAARNSDDLFDFTLFLSPSDVYAMMISEGADGLPFLSVPSDETSCTLPAKATLNGAKFSTQRLDADMHTDVGVIAGTREGYVEIINMGDVVSGSDLADEIVHSAGVAKCTYSVLSSVQRDDGTGAGNLGDGFIGAGTSAANAGEIQVEAPTGGLTANWTIINVPGKSAWTGEASAFDYAAAQAQFFRQANAAPLVAGEALTDVTADFIFLNAAPVTARAFDFPDFSTPYDNSADPVAWRDFLTAILKTNLVANEYITGGVAAAETDWVFSQPTRRYHVAGRDADDNGQLSAAEEDVLAANRVYSGAYSFTTNCTTIGSGTAQHYFDRNEQEVQGDDIVISPNPVAAAPDLCGEVAVISFNRSGATTSGAIRAELTVNDITTPFANGWAVLDLSTTIGGFNNNGLPVIGNAMVRAYNPDANFGGTWALRTP